MYGELRMADLLPLRLFTIHPLAFTGFRPLGK